jgi:hypothetical protein
MHRRTRGVMKLFQTVSVLALLLTSCGEGSGRATSDVETVVDTVAGVVHIRNSGTAPALAAEPVLRLGSIEGGPEEFGRIRSVIADAEGNIYAADNLAHQIRVFAPDGRHIRTIGRQGAGPGEFGDLYSLAWLDGNIAAMDPRNARIALLSRSGEWIDGIRHFPITGPASMIRLHPLGDDGFYAPIIAPGRQALPFARFTATGPADTIPAPQPPAEVRPTGVLCHRPDGGITSISMPQSPGIVYAFAPSGGEIAVSWTETYRIAVLDQSGDTLRAVTRERPPVPYTDELWEDGMRPYRELRNNFPGAQCQPSAPQRPTHRAALRHILFDEHGRMWIEAAGENGFLWEVFDSDGRLLGSAPAPPRVAGIPPYVRNGHLYQVETDELDVQYLAVYRINLQP